MEHGLSPAKDLPTNRAGSSTHPVVLLQVAVESLDEGCPLITNVTSPGFVVLVVPVHVVHQPSEPTALFIAELTDAEDLDTRGDFLLGCVAHLAGLGFFADPADRSPSLPRLCKWRWRGRGHHLAAVGAGPSSLVIRLSWRQSVVARAARGHNPGEGLADLNMTDQSYYSPLLPFPSCRVEHARTLHAFKCVFMHNNKGAQNRSFLYMEATYHAITTH